MGKINKTQIEIKKNLLNNPEGTTFVKKDTIYFLNHGRLNSIREFVNKYGEKITALGYEIGDSMYYQHLFDRYPNHLKKLQEFLKS